jgi:3-hydroxybutyryl-CoA dehydratase
LVGVAAAGAGVVEGGVIEVGDRFDLEFVWSNEDLAAFAAATGDDNPIHVDDEAARAAGFPGRIAHGMAAGAVFSRILGSMFPGAGTIYLRQSLSFLAPVLPGVALRASVVVMGRERRRLTLSTELRGVAEDRSLVEGVAEVLAPRGR